MGGQRIDDHGSPFGKQWPLPKGAHTKDYSSAEGAGAVSRYEDTTEAIKEQQVMGDKKVKSHPMKPGYRN